MGFEKHVLNVVAEVTDTPAYFANGTLFLTTNDSAEAVKVFNHLWNNVTAALSFVKSGNETSYDFL
jgi:hypothetical protein